MNCDVSSARNSGKYSVGWRLGSIEWHQVLNYWKYTTLQIQCIYGFHLSLGCLIPCGLDKSNNRSLKTNYYAEISVACNRKQKEIDTQGMMCRPIEV